MQMSVLNQGTAGSTGGGGCGSGSTGWTTNQITMKTGIQRSDEWHHKDLAEYVANIGVRCGHQCEYCSTKAITRTHPSYKQFGKTPTQKGFSITDPASDVRLAADAKKHKGKRGRVQFCSIVDGWAPDVIPGLGSRCISAILDEPDWTVRVLTKNAAVVKDYGVFLKYPKRIQVGLSITGTLAKQAIIATYESRTSSIQERMEALVQADKQGLRTYAMLCPLLPGIADSYDDVLKMVEFSKSHRAEEIFVEAINGRSDALPATQEALVAAGYAWEATQIERIRTGTNWSTYAADLGEKAQRAVKAVYGDDSRLRYLLYKKNLTPADEARMKALGGCVKWLGN